MTVSKIWVQNINKVKFLPSSYKQLRNLATTIKNTSKTQLKSINSSEWNKLEIKWGNGTMADWLKQLGKAFSKNTENFAWNTSGEWYRFKTNEVDNEFKRWANTEWEIDTNRWRVMLRNYNNNNDSFRYHPDLAWNLPAPFNCRTQNVFENLAILLWGGETSSKIFYLDPRKVGAFKSKEALEYLQKIAGDLEVEHEGLTTVNVTPPVPISTINGTYLLTSNLVSTRINLAYHLKIISQFEQEALRNRLVILESNRTYWKLIRDLDTRNWGIIQFINDNPPFSFANNGKNLVSDYQSWVRTKGRLEWALPINTNDGLFRNGFNGGHFRVVNQGVIHYLKEKFGDQKIRTHYAARKDSDKYRSLEWFLNEFWNDEGIYIRDDGNHYFDMSPTVGFWVHLSSGSGDLYNLRSLTKNQRGELKDRKIIIWDEIKGYRKLWKNVKADNLADICIPLHDFDDLVKKVKEADEEKTKMGKDKERLLTPNKQFASQEILGEWKNLVNHTGWYTTPVDGKRTQLGDLTVNDHLQGGQLSGTWNITNKGTTYQTVDAYEFVIATLLSNSNNLFRNNQSNYTQLGSNFLKKIVKQEDWESIEAEVDYRRFHRMKMEEFVDDDINRDIWVFLIDENRSAVLFDVNQLQNQQTQVIEKKQEESKKIVSQVAKPTEEVLKVEQKKTEASDLGYATTTLPMSEMEKKKLGEFLVEYTSLLDREVREYKSIMNNERFSEKKQICNEKIQDHEAKIEEMSPYIVKLK